MRRCCFARRITRPSSICNEANGVAQVASQLDMAVDVAIIASGVGRMTMPIFDAYDERLFDEELIFKWHRNRQGWRSIVDMIDEIFIGDFFRRRR